MDVSGDGPAYRLLEGSPLLDGERTAVLSAGMLPGLANVVPRMLAADLTDARLVVYAGVSSPSHRPRRAIWPCRWTAPMAPTAPVTGTAKHSPPG